MMSSHRLISLYGTKIWTSIMKGILTTDSIKFLSIRFIVSVHTSMYALHVSVHSVLLPNLDRSPSPWISAGSLIDNLLQISVITDLQLVRTWQRGLPYSFSTPTCSASLAIWRCTMCTHRHDTVHCSSCCSSHLSFILCIFDSQSDNFKL